MKTVLKGLILLILTIFFVIIATPVQAEVLSDSWDTNGSLIRNADSPDNTDFWEIIPDGQGGMIWGALMYTPRKPFIQRLNYNGSDQWTENGIDVDNGYSTAISSSYFDICEIYGGGIYVLWRGERSSEYQSIIQKFSGSGYRGFGNSGLLAGAGHTSAMIEENNNDGGVYFAFTSTGAVYARNYNYNGSELWEEDVLVHDEQSYPFIEAIEVDDSGNLYVAWQDGSDQLRVQKLNSLGEEQWTSSGGVVVSTYQPNISDDVTLVNDESGGVYISWSDNRNTTYNDIWLQRVDSSGNVVFTANGITPEGGAWDKRAPQIVGDGSGGVYITWRDFYSDPDWDVYTQYYNSSGSAQWSAGGSYMSSGWYVDYPQIIENGRGGVIITATDGAGDILTQSFDSSGNRLFSSDGRWLDTNGTTRDGRLKTVYNDYGGMIVAWADSRNYGSIYDSYYAQKLNYLHQVSDVDSSLDIIAGSNIESGSLSGIFGSTTAYIYDHDNNYVIADTRITLYTDQSWSNVIGDSDPISGKSFIANLSSEPGAAASHRLYVPYISGTDELWICPNATTSISEVSASCPGGYIDSGASVISGPGGLYWRSSLVTGTGGLGITNGVANMRVDMHNEQAGASDDIEVWFETPTDLTTNSVIYLVYDAGFTGGENLTVGDIGLKCDQDGLLGGTATSMLNFTIEQANVGYLAININNNACDDWVQVDIHGGNGNQLTNPSTPGNYGWGVVTDAGGDNTEDDSGAVLAYVQDDNVVDITTFVPATLDMELYKLNSDQELDDTNGCTLGVLSLNQISTCSYDLGTGTNNPAGVSIYMKSDGALDDNFGNSIGNPSGSVTSGESEYGIYLSDNGGGEYSFYNSFGSQHRTVPTNYILIARSASTGQGTTNGYNDQHLEITHAASMSTDTVVGSYDQEVTYVVYSN